MRKIYTDVYQHDWGFIIPCKSGVVWEQQTNGICCDHVYIEGVFIPLTKPIELLDALTNANYNGNETDKIWSCIKKAMHFDFDVIAAPKGQPKTQEGLIWIKITKFESGYGHCQWAEKLVGKKLALIYPNCD